MDSLVYLTFILGVVCIGLGVACFYLFKKNKELEDEDFNLGRELDRLEKEADDREVGGVEEPENDRTHVYEEFVEDVVWQPSVHGGFAGACIKLGSGKTLVVTEISEDVVIYEYESGAKYHIIVEENGTGYVLMEFSRMDDEIVGLGDADKSVIDVLFEDSDSHIEDLEEESVERVFPRRRRPPVEL